MTNAADLPSRKKVSLYIGMYQLRDSIKHKKLLKSNPLSGYSLVNLHKYMYLSMVVNFT